MQRAELRWGKIWKSWKGNVAFSVTRIGSACILLWLGFSSLTSPEVPQATLTVRITNLTSPKGKLWFAVFRPGDHFGEGKPNIYKIVDVTATSDQVVIFDLAPGRYALAVYQDLNGNEKLDKNFIGIPKEPYGFSNNFRPRFSAPKFEDCAFDLPAAGYTISVKMTD